MKYVSLRAEGVRHVVEVLSVCELDAERSVIKVRASEKFPKGHSFILTADRVSLVCVVSEVGEAGGSFVVELRALKNPLLANGSLDGAGHE